MTDTHAIVRTNPKGQSFRGRCINCGAENLTMSDVEKECPNPSGRTNEDSLMAILSGKTEQ